METFFLRVVKKLQKVRKMPGITGFREVWDRAVGRACTEQSWKRHPRRSELRPPNERLRMPWTGDPCVYSQFEPFAQSLLPRPCHIHHQTWQHPLKDPHCIPAGIAQRCGSLGAATLPSSPCTNTVPHSQLCLSAARLTGSGCNFMLL